MTKTEDSNENGESKNDRDWRTDGWKYTDQESGIYETRHEAIGEATKAARRMRKKYPDRPLPTPLEAIQRVYAFKPFRCGYCHETFLTEAEKEDHQPCPAWEEDKPMPPEGGSNPIEAARMTKQGL